jgi:membrane protease YdiL (CAAX protease family)
MDIPPDSPTSPVLAPRRSWPVRVIQFPLTRIVLALMFVVGTLLIVQVGVDWIVKLTGNDSYAKLLGACLLAAYACLSYAGFVRLVERRRVTELGPRGALVEFLAGALAGAGLISATIATMALLGAYRVEALNTPLVLLGPLGGALVSGFVEEIVARAILFRILEEWLGSWLAIAINAALFGLAHIANPNATLVASVAISLEAGVILAAAYMLTRRLWLAAGLHAAWNFTEAGIYGVAVSGQHTASLIKPEVSGPEWLTGGAFGAEASIPAVVICTAAGIALLIVAVQRGRVIAPFWRRLPAPTCRP